MRRDAPTIGGRRGHLGRRPSRAHTRQPRREPCAPRPSRSRRGSAADRRSRGERAAAPGDGGLFLETGAATAGGLPWATAAAVRERGAAAAAAPGVTCTRSGRRSQDRRKSRLPSDCDLWAKSKHVFNPQGTRKSLDWRHVRTCTWICSGGTTPRRPRSCTRRRGSARRARRRHRARPSRARSRQSRHAAAARRPSRVQPGLGRPSCAPRRRRWCR